MKRLFLSILLLTSYFFLPLLASAQSVAGLFPLQGSGRVVYNFNVGWRFHLGDATGAEATGYDDSQWPVVATPHSLTLVPAEASGGRNYQGPAWYRKHFTLPADMSGRNASLHFEAVMGKQRVYVNGRLVKEHTGGYLPFEVSLTEAGVRPGTDAVVAVFADNSDDGTYPPGKKQTALDFCYHGGIYRDVWLIGRAPVYITDPVEAGKQAGGGVFVHYGDITDSRAEMIVDVDIAAKGSTPLSAVRAQATLKDPDGRIVATKTIKALNTAHPQFAFNVSKPRLWTPDTPDLYTIDIRLSSARNGKAFDGGTVRTGIRNIEFRGAEGLWLNGKPYPSLIGGNRHQDFAYVGNALPNSQQWRDAKRLRDLGMTIIRSAHYPQDPAFMDACDELGLFVIVPTPGWQYWSKRPEFAQQVQQNTRLIIRRDRNHPCVIAWEPILNETRFPADFAKEALQVTIDEYPYPHRPVAAADMHSAGVADYGLLYGWPTDIAEGKAPADKCIFTREWGEMVDDWYAHNAINRCCRAWGERPQLIQAQSLADTYYEMSHTPRQFIGGCQWHPFDHQRGYHPDAYFGGVYDAFRQPKYAYHTFRANTQYGGPYLAVANEMTQFSNQDVVVFTNCDSVRLTTFDGDRIETQVPQKGYATFRGAWDFWKAREYSYKQRNWQRVSLLAEGYKDGQVVCREKKMPARRSTRLRLTCDSLRQLTADGSDFAVVVAEVTDDNGNVRRMARDEVRFTVQGEGNIIGDASISANPRIVEWGSAPALIRATTKPGTITIIAAPAHQGAHTPQPDTLTITTVAPALPLCYKDKLTVQQALLTPHSSPLTPLSDADRRRTLDEVEKQQQDFGIQ